MALFEIRAYKCEWCGRLFEHKESHWNCPYDPGARTCVSCARAQEIKRGKDGKVVYCPRADQVFEYPHDRYCPDYVQSDHYISYKP